MKKSGRSKDNSLEEWQIKLGSWKDNVLNRIFDFFSGDRTCSNCKHLKEKPHALDRYIAITTRRSHPIRMIKKCSLDGSVIRENEVRTKNCRYFKRKYGSAPIIRKIRYLVICFKRQWQLHYKIIVFIVTTLLAIIAILVAKGYI